MTLRHSTNLFIIIIIITIMCTVVTFGHRSAFPVLFDVESIEKWWKSSMVFKVYCKYPTQKMVSDDIHSYLLLQTSNLFTFCLLKSLL